MSTIDARLDELAALSDGWLDGEGLAPTPHAIATARAVLRLLPGARPHLFPTPDGEVSAAQIERVAQRLVRARPALWRIVVVHQPVAVTRATDQHNVLHGHEAAVRRWAAAGADLVVGGHIHLPFVLPLHERWTGLQRALWAVQAGTAVSDRVRAEVGNSVNVLRLAAMPRHGVVERWDHIAASERFERVAAHALSSADGP